MQSDGLLRPLVDMKLKNIRPGIMTDHIEVELAADDLCAVDVGDQDRFTLHVGPREKVAEWIDDAAAATRHDCLRVVAKRRAIVRGEVGPAVELITGEHEAPALD